MKNTFTKKIVLVVLSITAMLQAQQSLASQEHDAPKIVVPSNMTSQKQYPLVLLLHGYMSNKDLMDFWVGYSKQVDLRQFILVVPNGLKNRSGFRYWNASPSCCDFDNLKNDDIGYLKNVVEDTMSKYSIDRTRVFVVGHSNGAFMAHTLACEWSDVVTGIISFAGELDPPHPCYYSKPVSVLQIHAVDDKTIQFGGVLKGYTGLAPYPSTQETMQRVLKEDHCGSLVLTSDLYDLAELIPGADTNVYKAKGCANNSDVEFWKIRAFSSPIHNAHVPILTSEFTKRTLDFIFQHPRN